MTAWQCFPRLIPYLGPYRKIAAAAFAVVVFSSLLGLLTPWPMKILIDSVLADHPLPSLIAPLAPTPDEIGRLPLLVAVVASGLLLTALQRAIELINSYLQTKLDHAMQLDFRSDLFQHAQRLSLAYHSDRRIGDFLSRIGSQTASIGPVALAFLPLTQSLVTLVGMFAVAYTLDAGLALLSLVVVPFLYYSIGYYSSRIEPRVRQVRQMEADSLSILSETLAMLRVVLAFGGQQHEYRRFRNQSQDALDARLNLTLRQTAFSFIVNLTTAAGTSLVIGMGAYHVLRGDLTIGLLLVVITYIGSVYTPLQVISGTIGSLQERLVDVRLALEVLDTPPQIQDPPGAVDLERVRGELNFESICFSYDGRSQTLAEVSFRAEPGEFVAIVGPTGAGKTTLVSLLARFYAPSSGRIQIDGFDVSNVRLSSLRRQISLVTQEPLLFSGSVAENIRYGRRDAGQEEVVQAARAAEADEFISRLPQGYDTRVGELGNRLSVGERQRIALARAFLKDAPILILDEPTSSVDVETESAILQALKRLIAGRTALMIAHRFSTIRDADRILVLDQGRLIESGTHLQLMAQGGLYRRFYQRHQLEGGRKREAGSWKGGSMAEELPDWMVIQPLKRWPATLPAETLQVLDGLGLPREDRDARDPLASIVIVTFNGLPFTKLCLHSLLANTQGPAFEVILVDNGSQDGTLNWLERACARNPKLRLLANSRNLGFAAAANQGLAQAQGDCLVLLNSDTILTPGWLSGLIRHLQQPGTGMIGPVTNRCGNEAEVEASYRTYGELLRFARQRAESHSGSSLELGMLSLFCAAWPRRVRDEAGLLDDRFEVGTFEDDDFSLRVRQAGYRLACADDCFIHHFGQASFSQVGGSQEYQQRLKDNRQRFEAKWGRPWTPHRRRQDTLYLKLCEEIRALAQKVLPADARVLVVSRGDEELLKSLGSGYSHFPQDESGGYAGFYPADSQEAVAHLEDLIADGSQYLLFPQTSLWWLDHYSGLQSFLEERAHPVEADPEAAQIFRL